MNELPIHLVDHDTTVRTRPEATTETTGSTLIYEVLARSRQQEAERVAREYRVARRLRAGRFWTRLAAWADHRADRARAAVT